MQYKKELNIDDNEYVFSLNEKCEFIFYTINKTYDPMARWGEEAKSFNNLHGKVNPFTLFIEIEKFLKYLFSRGGVTYFYFSCEGERFEIYKFFVARLIKNSKYYTTIDKAKNEFYVYKQTTVI